jgi:hypothetical protein
MQIADEVLKWFSGLTAPVVAITVAYIGWQQYRINRDRARLDLYERRKAIHNAIVEFVSDVLNTGTASNQSLNRFRLQAWEAYFLFDQEVTDRLIELYDKGWKLHDMRAKLGNQSVPADAEHDALAGQQRELLNWFRKQQRAIEERMQKYMRFKQ